MRRFCRRPKKDREGRTFPGLTVPFAAELTFSFGLLFRKTHHAMMNFCIGKIVQIPVGGMQTPEVHKLSSEPFGIQQCMEAGLIEQAWPGFELSDTCHPWNWYAVSRCNIQKRLRIGALLLKSNDQDGRGSASSCYRSLKQTQTCVTNQPPPFSSR